MRWSAMLLAFSPVACSQILDWGNGIAQVAAADKSPGTGFVVALRSGRAYVVTCAHVVAGDPRPVVIFNTDPEKRRNPAEVRPQDRRNDLALLIIDRPLDGLRVLDPRLDLVLGDTPTFVGGYPGEAEGRFTRLRVDLTAVSGTELLLSPATEEGFSGGPVVANGQVIGVVSEHTRTFGKAIPAAIVELFLRGLDVPWGNGLSALAPGTVRENTTDGLKYVWIPAGKFMMGCSPGDAECSSNEKPPHEVEITRGFWMGQTEVTQAAFQKVMKENPSQFKGADRPVETVSWDETKAYCEAARMRLPTEAEWEYAARAENKEVRYGPLDQIAWYKDNSRGQTQPVAEKHPNSWGLYDMLGNVWEWTADWYDKDYYNQKVSKDPQGPGSPENLKVVRGGSWNDGPLLVRASYRDGNEPTYRFLSIGFRCAGELR